MLINRYWCEWQNLDLFSYTDDISRYLFVARNSLKIQNSPIAGYFVLK